MPMTKMMKIADADCEMFCDSEKPRRTGLGLPKLQQLPLLLRLRLKKLMMTTMMMLTE